MDFHGKHARRKWFALQITLRVVALIAVLVFALAFYVFVLLAFVWVSLQFVGSVPVGGR